MNNEFKKLLLKIAALPTRDQKWLLSHLSEKQQRQFNMLKGNELLSQARRFRKLPCPEVNQPTQTVQLPKLCQELMQQDPLYVAIILDQGQYNWEQQLLDSMDQGDQVKQLMNEVISRLKPATKLSVFQQWQVQYSFEDHLEVSHG